MGRLRIFALLPLAAALLTGHAGLRAQQPSPVEVTTDTFALSLSPRGGSPVQWTVVDPAGERAGGSPRHALLDPDVAAALPDGMFAVRIDGAPDQRVYAVQRASSAASEVVTLTAPPDASGLRVTKTYEFAPQGYLFGLQIELQNTGAEALAPTVEIVLGPGLGYSVGRRPKLFEEGRNTNVLPFFERGGSFYGYDVPREEPFALDYPPEGDEGAALDSGGIHSQYFVLALRPEAAEPGHFAHATIEVARTAPVPDGDSEHYPVLRLARGTISLAPGQRASSGYTVFAGPKDRDLLRGAGVGDGLEPVLFHHLWDWLAAICLGLQTLLAWLTGLVGSWGLAIVTFAVLFRLVTLPLSIYGAKQQVLMKAKMAELKPLVAELKQKHAKNSEAKDKAILELYKKHGVNPLSHFKGCLPLFVQLPVLIALFNLLLTANELRGEQFWWIDDLTLTDRLFPLGFSLPWLGSYFNLLPVVMFAAQLWTGRAMAKSQGDGEGISPLALLGMPVGMLLLFYPFPAGCMLFWTTGTVLQLFEQRLVARAVAATR